MNVVITDLFFISYDKKIKRCGASNNCFRHCLTTRSLWIEILLFIFLNVKEIIQAHNFRPFLSHTNGPVQVDLMVDRRSLDTPPPSLTSSSHSLLNGSIIFRNISTSERGNKGKAWKRLIRRGHFIYEIKFFRFQLRQ